MQEVQEATLKLNEVPGALALIKDWSIWLVSIRTGVLALITFIAGKEGWIKFEYWVARWAAYAAVVFFALSIAAATMVLAAIPSIRRRMSLGTEDPTYIAPNGNFYKEPAFTVFPVSPLGTPKIPFIVFSALEHWLFLGGIFAFVLALTIEKIRGTPPPAEQTPKDEEATQ